MYRCRLAYVLAMAGLAALLLPAFLHAQITFERTYGGLQQDVARDVKQTADGGYIITGYTKSFGVDPHGNIYLVRTDSAGDTLWTRTQGGPGPDMAYSVQQTADSGYIIAGNTGSFGAGYINVYLTKTDVNGDTLWTKTFGGDSFDYGHSVHQTADSGYIIAGLTESFGAGGEDVYLIKTDAHGDTLWTRAFGGAVAEEGLSVKQTTDGGFIVAGYTESFGAGNGDVYLIKTNEVGDTTWTRTYGGVDLDLGTSVQQTTDGGYVITGVTTSFGAGNGDVYLIKTDDAGDTTWTRTYGVVDYERGTSVQQTADGGYIIAGYTYSFGAGEGDVYLIKTDANGATKWTRTFGGGEDDTGRSVQQTTDGGYIIAGETQSFGAGEADVYLIKTDSLGIAVAEPKASPTRAPALSLSCEPNPSSGSMKISLQPQASSAKPLTLRVYDSQGCAVRSFSSLLPPPSSLTWDGGSDFGRPLPSGTYFIRCGVAGEHATTRIVLQR